MTIGGSDAGLVPSLKAAPSTSSSGLRPELSMRETTSASRRLDACHDNGKADACSIWCPPATQNAIAANEIPDSQKIGPPRVGPASRRECVGRSISIPPVLAGWLTKTGWTVDDSFRRSACATTSKSASMMSEAGARWGWADVSRPSSVMISPETGRAFRCSAIRPLRHSAERG
jgi:hypothetical protein